MYNIISIKNYPIDYVDGKILVEPSKMTIDSFKNAGFYMLLFNSFKKMMVTQIVSAVTAFLGVFVDIIVISRFLGTDCMAAFGFVNPYILILVATGLVFTIGTQSKVGRLLGKCDIESVNKVVSLSLFVEIILSICFSLIAFFFSKNIVMFFGTKGVVLNHASEYLKYLSFGLYGIIMGPLMTALMQIDNDISRSFISVFVMTLVNVILDILNAIYFNGGMKGMAIATVVSTICNTTIMLFHFFKLMF